MATGRMLLTINIRKYLVTQPRNKRAYKAIRYIRDRIAHYTKTDLENVKISQELNSQIVKRFSKNMSPVKLNIRIESGKAMAEPFAPEKPVAAKPGPGKEAHRPAEKKETPAQKG